MEFRIQFWASFLPRPAAGPLLAVALVALQNFEPLVARGPRPTSPGFLVAGSLVLVFTPLSFPFSNLLYFYLPFFSFFFLFAFSF